MKKAIFTILSVFVLSLFSSTAVFADSSISGWRNQYYVNGVPTAYFKYENNVLYCFDKNNIRLGTYTGWTTSDNIHFYYLDKGNVVTDTRIVDGIRILNGCYTNTAFIKLNNEINSGIETDIVKPNCDNIKFTIYNSDDIKFDFILSSVTIDKYENNGWKHCEYNNGISNLLSYTPKVDANGNTYLNVTIDFYKN